MGGSSANRRKTRGRQTAQAAGILVVNMIPKALSGEAEQDSEPSLAVNPADPSQIVASAFPGSAGRQSRPDLRLERRRANLDPPIDGTQQRHHR
jgi:hypothetical protein